MREYINVKTSGSNDPLYYPLTWTDLETGGDNKIALCVFDKDLATVAFSITTTGGVNYSVSWGDGYTTSHASESTAQHTYIAGTGKDSKSGYTTFKVLISSANNIIAFNVKRHSGNTGDQITNILAARFSTRFLNTLEKLFYDNTAQQVVSYNLQFAYFPTELNNVTRMNQAFYICYDLKVLELPDSMNVLNSATMAFYNCGSVVKLKFPTSAPLLTACESMCANCFSLKSFTFPQTMNALTTMANCFNGCYSLETIEMPLYANTLQNLSTLCYSCGRLKSFTFPQTMNALTTIATAFYFCSRLKTVTMPVSSLNLFEIQQMFNRCFLLDTVNNIELTGSNSLQINASYMFYLTGKINSLTINKKLSAFGACGNPNVPISLQSLRLTNGQSLYEGSSPQIAISYSNMGTAALNTLFGDLVTLSGKTIDITGCPGAATCNRSIATAKGWTVTG